LWDIVAYNSDSGDIYFIQCKKGKSKVSDVDSFNMSLHSKRMSFYEIVHFWKVSKLMRGLPITIEVIG